MKYMIINNMPAHAKNLIKSSSIISTIPMPSPSLDGTSRLSAIGNAVLCVAMYDSFSRSYMLYLLAYFVWSHALETDQVPGALLLGYPEAVPVKFPAHLAALVEFGGHTLL
jgi:hypothetical protein